VVQKTILVPQMVPETRLVSVTEYHTEVRQRTVTIQRPVVETQMVTENYTVMVPQQQIRTETFTVKHPVVEQVPQTYTVPVPHQEMRQGVRSECQPVQVQEMKTICREEGYWETVTCQVPCSGCGGCSSCGTHFHTVSKQVWRSNPVLEQVPVTVWKTQIVQVPYEYMTTVYRPETRTRMTSVMRFVSETKTRQVPDIQYVAQQHTRTRPVTTHRMVSEQHVQDYTVCVPTVVQKPVTVMVCQMVPQTVTCQVPVPCCP
jgi:hypothetical protein